MSDLIIDILTITLISLDQVLSPYIRFVVALAVLVLVMAVGAMAIYSITHAIDDSGT